MQENESRRSFERLDILGKKRRGPESLVSAIKVIWVGDSYQIMRETGPFKIMKMQEFQRPGAVHAHKQKTWNFPELVRYTLYLHSFLERNQERGQARWSRHEYEQMAGVVRSRNSNQCRIFHSKMTHIHHDLVDIFNFFRGNIKEYNSIRDRFNKEHTRAVNLQETPLGSRQIEDLQQQIDPGRQIVEQSLGQFGHLMDDIRQDFSVPKPQNEEERMQRVRRDWFEEFDDYLNGLQGSWLDDI